MKITIMLTKKHQIDFYHFYYAEMYNLQYLKFIYKIILINQGSLTQNINSIVGQQISIHLIQQHKQYNYHTIRKVWIQNTSIKLIFAESLWQKTNPQINHITHRKGIGQNIINNELDTYKNIHQITYSYDYMFEHIFHKYSPFWSRAYTINHHAQKLIHIKESISNFLI